MMYELPSTLEVCGIEYRIRSDYRAALDICTALSDSELAEQERVLIALDTLYPEFENMPYEHYENAAKKCFWFISCGDDNQGGNSPKLVDWEQDFKYIVSPINRVCGYEIRSVEYMHWWTFISAYYEIGGDCTFAQIVRIREKIARGKTLDKQDREWYRKNQHLVDMKPTYTSRDEETLRVWGA